MERASRPEWAPPDVDQDRASAARVYDYLLGGCHNFAADRTLAEQILGLDPNARLYAHANRAFLRRAVRFLADQGVRQYLDIGSGIPTVGNTHEVAQAVAPEARVVYVDVDQVAVAHSLAILRGNELAGAAVGDLRHSQRILADPTVRGLIDFRQPVGLLLVAVLHFVADEYGPAAILAEFYRHLAPGSFLVASHGTWPHAGANAAVAEQVRDAYTLSATPLTLRTGDQFAALLGGWEPIGPGVVDPNRWLPEPGTEDGSAVPGLAVVAMRP